GGGLFGVCNGFQVLVKAGLLPGGSAGRDQITVTYNDSAKFEARWVRMEVCTDHCAFLKPGTFLEAPVDHAEGKVVTANPEVAERLAQAGQIALRYVDAEGRHDRYPANPNGSEGGIAGLCDPTGRVFGLMPHLEDHFTPTQHPLWTRHEALDLPAGLAVLQNAVQYWGSA
ncbi:MAG: phosphoribosylformylglycinamidine synthase subunit PurQ, partial [Planctomycetes bacterium]|nr:phosphoribosylformylglycinamidine synthase subunit PurQ [Planctomycetota bacterium]